jgi:serine/threonine protein kinase
MIYSLGIILAEILTGMPPVIITPFHESRHLKILLSTVITDNIPFVPTGSVAQEVYRSSLLNSNILLESSTKKEWPKGSWERLGYSIRRCIDPDPTRRPYLFELLDEMRKILEEPHHRCAGCPKVGQANAHLRCGHDILCLHCVRNFIIKGSGCPLCLAPIIQIL